ncbi:unnamed protein product [Microthlaspi erraticum]|uniref:F-box associated beta-propeller type 1 domain-containing protein n=1 Tax=Microthlaspi erraticum TaxID=1685480 RepID=A0A6D2I035_9BRAS|nr:unnamed protein product [Microthlaspi erraticum]
MHIEQAAATATRERESQLIMLMDHNLYLKSVVFDVDPLIKPRGKLTCLGEQVKISRVFHCDGLLLCMLKDNAMVVVWNPYLRQTRRIEPSCHSRRLYDGNIYMYALGYENKKNKACRSHKILKLYNERAKYRLSCYEIYNLDSGLWRTLDVPPHTWFLNHDETESSVSLKGNTYCVL